LLESFEQWTWALDEEYGIDYRKAFDTVPHRKLLLKLRNYEFTDKYINCIKNFPYETLQGKIQDAMFDYAR